MLRIIIKEKGFNDETNEFSSIDPVVIDLEHSLLSLSKWESKYQKSFLAKEKKTVEEMFAYIMCMLLTEDIGVEVLSRLSQEQFQEINDYLESPNSATTFKSSVKESRQTEVITSELIYYWMVAFSIPFTAETWNLNNLFSLIRICNIKNAKPTKQSRAEMARHRHDVNQRRRAELGSSG